MSTAAAPRVSTKSRAYQFVALALLVGIALVVDRVSPGFHEGAELVESLGFLLMAGALTSELIERFGVPHLTGYLIAGILSGPHVLKIVDHHSVEQLAPVNTLALALIAFQGGAHLKLELMRDSLKSVLWALFVHSVLGLILMTLVFMAAAPLIPFMSEFGLKERIGISLLWGVVAVSRSPSAALGILSQTRAEGPLARFSLAFIMASDVVAVVLLATILCISRPLIEAGAQLSSQAFIDLGHEVIGSVSIGTTLGLLIVVYLRLVGRQLLVVFVGLGFGVSEVLHYLKYDPLLTFMVAGFLVQNLSKQGEKLLEGAEQMGSVVFVVFFANAGAHLDLPLLRVMWPVALALCTARAVVSVTSARIANKFAGDEGVVRRYGWGSLISQAGFALGLAQVVSKEFPMVGPGFRALAIATVGINEFVGPIIFKLTLDRAEESKSPNALLSDAEEGEPSADTALD